MPRNAISDEEDHELEDDNMPRNAISDEEDHELEDDDGEPVHGDPVEHGDNDDEDDDDDEMEIGYSLAEMTSLIQVEIRIVRNHLVIIEKSICIVTKARGIERGISAVWGEMNASRSVLAASIDDRLRNPVIVLLSTGGGYQGSDYVAS